MMAVVCFLPRCGLQKLSALCCAALLWTVVLLPAGPARAAAAAAPCGEITVSAAASLTDAFTRLKDLFEKANPGCTVHLNFAASNPLLKQMQEGAPVDVFASADQETMDKAAASGLLDAASRRDFARNSLVLIVPAGSAKPENLNALKKLQRIAVGNPDSVPAGRYTRDALTAAGLWNALQPRLVPGNNVRQVLEYTARGEVDAGFVYASDARQRADKVEVVMTVRGHKPMLYPAALVVNGANAPGGRKFLQFLFSPQGQKTLAEYGFAAP